MKSSLITSSLEKGFIDAVFYYPITEITLYEINHEEEISMIRGSVESSKWNSQLFSDACLEKRLITDNT